MRFVDCLWRNITHRCHLKQCAENLTVAENGAKKFCSTYNLSTITVCICTRMIWMINWENAFVHIAIRVWIRPIRYQHGGKTARTLVTPTLGRCWISLVMTRIVWIRNFETISISRTQYIVHKAYYNIGNTIFERRNWDPHNRARTHSRVRRTAHCRCTAASRDNCFGRTRRHANQYDRCICRSSRRTCRDWNKAFRRDIVCGRNWRQYIYSH